MAYQFYQNSKLVQNQLEQNEDSVNQSIQSSINEYKQNFAQANYDYAVDLAQEQAGKGIEKMLGENELLAGIPATFNALKKGVPAAKNLINKIRGTPTEEQEIPSVPDESLGEAPKQSLPEEPVERSVEYDNPAFSGSDLSESASGLTENVLGEDIDTGSRGVLSAEDVNQLTFPAESTSDVADSTASDIITSSVQATDDVVEKAASKSIWEEIGDGIADVGLGALDILDPVADIAEAGIAVAGVGLGAKSIADAEKPTKIAPPVEQQQSLLQTSNISAVSQPGI
jgi:hypothetical protein